MTSIKLMAGVDDHDLHLFQDAVNLYDDLLLHEASIQPRPVLQATLDGFLALPIGQRQSVVEQILLYTEILADASRERISLTEDKRLSWYAMKLLNLIPPPGLLELVGEDDYTEIYNRDGIQIFRNLEFYKLFSYTIADMTLNTWEQLYHRDEKIKAQIVDQGFVKGFSGLVDPYKLTIDDHQIAEAMSAEKRDFSVSFGYLAPLRDRRREIVAVFATSKIKALTRGVAKKGA